MNPQDELLFIMTDPSGGYTSDLICDLLKKAESQGHPLERGSYLAEMTVRQLDALVHGKTDA
jgi:hypothetical protein